MCPAVTDIIGMRAALAGSRFGAVPSGEPGSDSLAGYVISICVTQIGAMHAAALVML
jgi:hypothetical protein